MQPGINGKKVAILVADGFEESEMVEPKKALEKAGALTFVVSPSVHEVRAWSGNNWGKSYLVDIPLAEANALEFDALVLPGGVKNPDTLRMDQRAVEFVKEFVRDNKPICAICHGPWTLIETGAVEGLKMTSYRSIKTDLENAGANWMDKEVVVDRGIVTSRSPSDIPAFNQKMLEEIAEGRHPGRQAASEEYLHPT